MAPVPLDSEIRYLPVAAAAGHGLGIIVLVSLVVRSLHHSYCQLSPAQGTRERRIRRSKFTPLFAGLAIASLAFAGHAASKYSKLSYQVWADQRGLEVPERCVWNIVTEM